MYSKYWARFVFQNFSTSIAIMYKKASLRYGLRSADAVAQGFPLLAFSVRKHHVKKFHHHVGLVGFGLIMLLDPGGEPSFTFLCLIEHLIHKFCLFLFVFTQCMKLFRILFRSIKTILSL